MIESMDANALHFDLPPADRPGLTPWIVVLVCAAILILLISQLLRQIPETLELNARGVLSNSEYPDLSVKADGRILQLRGTVDTDKPITSLVERLSAITGVQTVVQNVTMIDKASVLEASRQSFLQALAKIDTRGVAFLPGSASFTEESAAPLAQLHAVLENYPQGRVRIEGHTDNTGPDSVNLRISRDRAAAVANYLMARGVSADQLIVKGYGSTQPIDDNNTANGRASNRRIEVSPVN